MFLIPSLPPVTEAEIAAFPSQKASATAKALFQADDYLPAYARHTDLRVVQDGPAAAIGGDWEAGGARQFAFLKAQGLTPQMRVLDVGCGTGRLARHLVPWLAPGGYTGIDLSAAALQALQQLAGAEGWGHAYRVFQGDGTLGVVAGESFDILWCYAVLQHLPLGVIAALLCSLQSLAFGRLWATYKDGAVHQRTGVKQFTTPLPVLQTLAASCGYRVQRVAGMPHLPQALLLLTPEAPW